MTARKSPNARYSTLGIAPKTPHERTAEAAKQVISDDLKQRDENIARLRALRIAKEAQDAATDAATAPARKKRPT
ncbi:hypothetical protein SAMN04489859_11061 [Paracoccus alcaliphilus]|uniref:Uncharacterized protein n=1 Tax=Paracoccus alcaliphilus TaxID=34002 RepID=A0A1H8PMI9_9RHOB|nr:hypothetical protein [Paracoccus alcaliphilus]WCR19105.1 hypothetical protein JHW40_05300 [Paracoccus alcaliphilus]SEO43192.1 hypothetical protein SAMN04489859_11061 [Paracoccus alcaliphilus]